MSNSNENMNNSNTVAEGDFSFIHCNMTSEMLDNAYKAITKHNLWNFFKTEDPPENKGYMFWDSSELSKLNPELEEMGHSGSSYGWTMRMMQKIARTPWSDWVNQMKKSQGSKPPKSTNLPVSRSVTPPPKPSNLKTLGDYNLGDIYKNFDNPDALVKVPEIDKLYLWARGIGHLMYVVRIRMVTTTGLHVKTFDQMKGEIELFIPSEHQRLFYLPGDVPVKATPVPETSVTVREPTAIDGLNLIAKAQAEFKKDPTKNAFSVFVEVTKSDPAFAEQGKVLEKFAKGEISYSEMRSKCG
jgi:hypothetical protein